MSSRGKAVLTNNIFRLIKEKGETAFSAEKVNGIVIAGTQQWMGMFPKPEMPKLNITNYDDVVAGKAQLGATNENNTFLIRKHNKAMEAWQDNIYRYLPGIGSLDNVIRRFPRTQLLISQSTSANDTIRIDLEFSFIEKPNITVEFIGIFMSDILAYVHYYPKNTVENPTRKTINMRMQFGNAQRQQLQDKDEDNA